MITSREIENCIEMSQQFFPGLCGKPSYDPVPLKEIYWAAIINRNLIRGVEKSIRGCKNEGGTCQLESMVEHVKKKTCSFHMHVSGS